MSSSSSKKRSHLHLHEPDDDLLVIDKEEIAKLTKLAKSWDYTCSFCFKKFPSAQAMGGHQNSHRSERLEEKRLFVKDPIGHRKRVYLRALKKAELSALEDNLHAADNNDMSSPTGVLVSSPSDQQLTNAAGNNNHGGPSGSKDVMVAINGGDAAQVKNSNLPSPAVVAPAPLKELNLLEKIVGDYCDKDGSGSCFDQFNRGVEVMEEDLALTL